jgi:segregation and condensation protein A
VAALSELTVRWTGTDDASVEDLVTDEFDGAPPEAEAEQAQEAPQAEEETT